MEEHLCYLANADEIPERKMPTNTSRNTDDHGTRRSYRRGCRCPRCRAAQRSYHHAYRAARLGSTTTPHGTDDGYTNWSCRCQSCRRAHADARAARP